MALYYNAPSSWQARVKLGCSYENTLVLFNWMWIRGWIQRVHVCWWLNRQSIPGNLGTSAQKEEVCHLPWWSLKLWSVAVRGLHRIAPSNVWDYQCHELHHEARFLGHHLLVPHVDINSNHLCMVSWCLNAIIFKNFPHQGTYRFLKWESCGPAMEQQASDSTQWVLCVGCSKTTCWGCFTCVSHVIKTRQFIHFLLCIATQNQRCW